MKRISIIIAAIAALSFSLAASPVVKSNKLSNKPVVATMASMIEGQIVFEVPLGSHVKKGQLVEEVDPQEYKADVLKDLSAIKYYQILYNSNKRLVKSGSVAQKDFYKSEYDLRSAIANYEHDKAVLRHCKIYSPFDGVVTKVNTYVSSGIGDGSPIMEITKDVEA